MRTDEIKMLGWPILVTVAFVSVALSVGYLMDNVPITVYKGEQIVYSGTSACVSVRSSGDTTTVKIGRGPWCLLPKAYYVGHDIQIAGSR